MNINLEEKGTTHRIIRQLHIVYTIQKINQSDEFSYTSTTWYEMVHAKRGRLHIVLNVVLIFKGKEKKNERRENIKRKWHLQKGK